jgi:hypothetical protein
MGARPSAAPPEDTSMQTILLNAHAEVRRAPRSLAEPRRRVPPPAPAPALTAPRVPPASPAARAQGVKRHRRIQRPILALLALCVSGVSFYGYCYVFVARGSAQRVAVMRTFPILMAVLAATPVLLFLMLTHTQPKRVAKTICVVVLIFLTEPLKLVFDLVLLFSGRRLAGSYNNELRPCEGASDAGCRASSTALIVLALALPAMYALAALALVLTLLRRPSTGVLIARLQKVLIALYVAVGVVRLVRLVVKIGSIRGFDGAASEDIPDCIFGLYFCFALVAYSETVRVRVRAWLASIGGQMSSAVCIAELLGAGHVHSIVATAQSRFTCVYACDVTVQGFTSEGDPESALKVRPTHFGSCDCFVSHSWSDDPHAKHAAFVQWADDFRERYHREPTVWLDRYWCAPRARAPPPAFARALWGAAAAAAARARARRAPPPPRASASAGG